MELIRQNGIEGTVVKYILRLQKGDDVTRYCNEGKNRVILRLYKFPEKGHDNICYYNASIEFKHENFVTNLNARPDLPTIKIGMDITKLNDQSYILYVLSHLLKEQYFDSDLPPQSRKINLDDGIYTDDKGNKLHAGNYVGECYETTTNGKRGLVTVFDKHRGEESYQAYLPIIEEKKRSQKFKQEKAEIEQKYKAAIQQLEQAYYRDMNKLASDYKIPNSDMKIKDFNNLTGEWKVEPKY